MISMDPLFKAALLRTLGFFLLTSLSAWLFVLVEYESEETSKGKYQLLRSLYMSMTSKYNMTIEEFNNFSNMANEALSDPKPRWTFIAAFEFVISVVTTIGKKKQELVRINVTHLAETSMQSFVSEWHHLRWNMFYSASNLLTTFHVYRETFQVLCVRSQNRDFGHHIIQNLHWKLLSFYNFSLGSLVTTEIKKISFWCLDFHSLEELSYNWQLLNQWWNS